MKTILLISILFVTSESVAAELAKSKPTAPKSSTAPVTTASLAPASKKLSVLNMAIRKPATLDPNSAVEVRGQARTLSMMLVLKNGKDSINFIKVRKDYRPEIFKTEF